MRNAISISLASLVLANPALGQDVAKSADSTMRAAEAQGFSGAVRLTRRGNVVLEKGYGLANREGNIVFTPSTVVQIGSNTKDFTAVAILQLQDQGKLDVKDKLSKFFPNAPADKRDITIWQLMLHEAGFPLGLGGDFDPVSRQQLIDNAMAFKLLFEPGARESYSNTGYSLLAAIIEQVSGKMYDEYVRDNILEPAGMKRTGFLLPQFATADLAHGYEVNGNDAGTLLAKPHAADGPYWNLRGNGGMLSTVGDMDAFYTALLETDKLLKPETRNLRFNPAEPIGLAGSDLVNFFLYERDPMSGVVMIIASTNAKMKAPVVRRPLAHLMGLPENTGKDDAARVARAVGKRVSAPVAAVINEFVAAINKGDRDVLLKFINEHFVASSDGPAPSERADRLSGLRQNLGAFNVVRMGQMEDGTVQTLVNTEREGEALMIMNFDTGSTVRIKRFGLQVGN